MSRGIFGSDRLKFALHLTHDLFSKEIPEVEWNVFIGKHNVGKSETEEIPPWIPKQCTVTCQNLQVNGIYDSVFISDIRGVFEK